VSPVKYELGFYIPEDDILHSHRSASLKSDIVRNYLSKGTLHLKNSYMKICVLLPLDLIPILQQSSPSITVECCNRIRRKCHRKFLYLSGTTISEILADYFKESHSLISSVTFET
jgi:hypothetical protein